MPAPLLVALGETSYSIYLVHSWTLRLFEQPVVGFNRVTAGYAVYRVICGIGLTFLVSHASYRLIELPGRVWVRGTLRRGIAFAFRDRQRSAATPDRRTPPADSCVAASRRPVPIGHRRAFKRRRPIPNAPLRRIDAMRRRQPPRPSTTLPI